MSAIRPLLSPTPGPSSTTYESPGWQYSGEQNNPGNRYSAATAYDPVRKQTVVFGGCVTATGVCGSSDTLVLGDGVAGPTWTLLNPATSPSGRSAAVMVWDPALNKVVLFGGTAASGARMNDTWTWDGTTWTQVFGSGTRPSARSGAAMAYDPDRNGLVLFGGQTSSSAVADNDTWVFGTTGWTQVLASGQSGAPTYRTNAMLAYLGTGTGGQLVLFGGAACSSSGCSNPSAVNDTWVLPTSGSWVQQTPGQSPPAVQASVFVYDYGLDADVLVGGLDANNTASNATWAWTGTNWLKAQDGTALLPSRYFAQAVSVGDEIRIYGGVVPAGTSNGELDTWSYSARQPILGIAVTNDVTSANLFLTGQVVKVTVTAENTGLDTLTSTDGESITAALSSGGQSILEAAGSTVTWAVNPNDPVPSCRSLPAGSAVSTLVAGVVPTISRAALSAGCTATATFLAVVAGSPEGCALQTITAAASGQYGSTGTATTTLPVCGGGLGKEDWWSYDSTGLGGGATADVNVANGNLVVKQSDTTPILSHGDLGYSLNRAYNSQALVSGDLNGQKSVLGQGWQLDMGDTGASSSGITLGSLIVPAAGQLLDPLAVTYVDRDGTRFVFRPKTPTLGNVTGTLLGATGLLSNVNLTNLLQLPNIYGQDLKSILDSLSNGNSPPLICIDTTYSPPPGADMYLFRYLGFAGGSGASDCASAVASRGVTIGYSLVRPDRIRYDFNLLGQLSDTVDGAGNNLIYTYDGSNRPSSIYSGACVPTGQPAASGVPTGNACPRYTFTYNTNAGVPGTRIDVTDPAGRLTTYVVASPDLAHGSPEELTQVWNPDNPFSLTGTPSERYTYSTTASRCLGSDTTASTIGQLCSATDALGATTTFGYTQAPVGPDRVLSVTDRRANSSAADGGPSRGNMVRYHYTDATTAADGTVTPGTMIADSAPPNTFGANGAGCANNAACERVRYAGIDPVGSVGEIDEGDASDAYWHQQAYFWDSDTTDNVQPCRQPDALVDYNLCQTITRAKVSNTPLTQDHPGTATQNGVTVADHATRYVYGDLGQVLRQQSVIDPSQPWTDANSVTTTMGSHDQYVEAGDQIRAFDDTPKGSGIVDSTGGNATGSYGDAIGNDSPAAFYRFAEATGQTATDSSGNHQDATYVGNEAHGLPGGVPGDVAVGDPGSGGFIAGLNHLTGFAAGTGKSSAFTVEAWEQTTNADFNAVACSGCGDASMTVGRFNGAPVLQLADTAGGKIAVAATASIADGVWHQVDYSYNGNGHASGVAIYVDGQRVATTTSSDTLTGAYRADSDPLILGYSFNGATNDGSNLSDVALFTGALPASRVSAHYKAAHSVARADATTLYAVTDQTGMLTPRGNDPANASHWGDYLTSYIRDVPALPQSTPTSSATSAATPNRPLTDPVCDSSVSNTGLLCATVMPASSGVAAGDCPASAIGTVTNPPGSAPHTCTTSTYNRFGEMTAKRSANAHASGASAKTLFTYYADTGSCTATDNGGTGHANCDLSGGVSAGGWLKAVTDTSGHSVIYAYDRAGNIARTWDRNATAGHTLDEDWTNPSTPPSAKYAETDYANAVTSNSLSAGAKDVEVIHADGTVWGSGANSQNELGTNTATGPGQATGTAVPAAGFGRAVQVVQNGLGGPSGTLMTLARTTAGAVYAWGNNTPVTRIGNLPPIISLAAGGQHYLALDTTGAVWAWGANNAGQLGNGSTSATSTPVKVLTGVSAITAGATSSYAVKTDGTVWAWGDNSYGQLATGDTTNHTSPTKTTGLSRVLAVAAGTTTAYAIEADGSVWSWGDNTAGALGTGSSDATAATPARIATLGPGTTAGTVRQIVGAAFGAAALTSDGHVYAWGLNSTGQLGHGTSSNANGTTPAVVPDVAGQLALAGGWATYVTADAGGYLTVWGDTNSGQHGNGTGPSIQTPLPTVHSQNVSPYASPWRYGRAQRDPVGNLMTVVASPNGDTIQTTPARGTAVMTTAYDSSATYSANDQQLTAITPLERDSRDSNGALTGTAAPTAVTYDTFGNATVTVDPRGNATVASYDSVNRKTSVATTRDTPGNAAGSGCTGNASSAAGFSAQQNGHVVCTLSATYDGNDQTITASDALAQTQRTTFDGLGRKTAVATPRNDGTLTSLITRVTYDADGHTLDSCPPRQNVATGDCTGSGVYSTHTRYDAAGHATDMTRYRADPTADPSNNGPQTTKTLTTSMSYDADGNQIASTDPNGHTTTSTYDLLDRRQSMSTPRLGEVRNTTRWRYDASGNTTAVLAPGAAPLGSGADGPLVVDGATYPKSNPYRVPDQAQYTTVTLTNGGWITGQNGGLVFAASGAVTICSTCGATEAGAGLAGGAGGANGTLSANNGADGADARTGGKGGPGSALYAGGGGGGGHKSSGAAGLSGTVSGGAGGGAFPSTAFAGIGTNYLAASGGGGGGGGHSSLDNVDGDNGGNGGGFIHITADTITVNGTVDASGAAGQDSPADGGAGGGGGGGSIWLAASTVGFASGSTVTVAGGAGGKVGSLAGAGGNGSAGLLRIDSDNPIPAGADANGTLSNVTAYSYDADNRPLDTLTGAQTTNAADTGEAGVPDGSGVTNTRTRTTYDPDGHTVATLPSQAFGSTGSPAHLTADGDYIQRTDYDLDGRPVATYTPRYNATTSDLGGGNDAGTGTNQQTSQCPTGATPNLAAVADYSSGVGVCVTRMRYDANGNMVRQWLPTSNGHDNRYLARTYTDDNLVVSETAPDPSKSDSGSDRVADHTLLYDGDQRPIEDTDANGNSTTTSYTADGLKSETDGQCYNTGGTNTSGCTWNGGTTVTHRTLYGYDADGNATTVTAPRAQAPDQADGSGLTAADFTTTTTWTSDGLKYKIQALGLGHNDFDTTTYSYDNVGNPLTTTTPSANATPADENNPGRLSTSYTYTDDNLIASSSTPVTTNSFRNTLYSYNPAGQKTATNICTTSSRTTCPGVASRNPDYGVTRYTYGPNGLNISQVAKASHADNDPTSITTSYDPAGRPKAITNIDPATNTTTIVSAGYYLDGLLRTAQSTTTTSSATTTDNTNTYAYDAAGRLTSRTDKTDTGGITDGAVKRTSYSYNNFGLLATMISDVHTGDVTTLAYDPAGRMTTWTDTGGGTGQTRDYRYFDDDTVRSVNTRASGDGSDRADYAYTYDNDGNILTQTATGSANNYTNTYRYNPAANTTGYNHTANGTDSTSSSSTTYSWDHNANRLTANTSSGATSSNQTWHYRADNSIGSQTIANTGLPTATYTYSYDQAGLLKTIANGGTVCTSNTYDDFDRTHSTTTTGDATNCGTPAGAPTSTVTYAYDGLDRQRSATTSKPTDLGPTVTKTIYDGLTSNTSGQTKPASGDGSVKSSLYELTPEGKHVSVWQANTTSSAASLIDDDANGNTSLLIDSSKSGTAATGCSTSYDPFGNPTKATASATMINGNGVCNSGSDASTTGNTSWYRDQTRDATGTYQLGTRTYNPANGSFSSPDQYRVATPASDLAVGTDPLTANNYAYVNGNPLNMSDPDGHHPVGDNGQALPYCYWHTCSAAQRKANQAAINTYNRAELASNAAYEAYAASQKSTPSAPDQPKEGPGQPEAMPGPGYYPATSPECGGVSIVCLILGPAISTVKSVVSCVKNPGVRSCGEAVINGTIAACAVLTDDLCSVLSEEAEVGEGIEEEAPVVSQILANKIAGDKAEDAVASQLGDSVTGRQMSITTDLGVRRIDIVQDGYVGHEVKLGRVSLDSSVRAQIAKDKWILDNRDEARGITEIHWNFLESSVTGKIGPTESVINALKDAGITYSVLPRYVHG